MVVSIILGCVCSFFPLHKDGLTMLLLVVVMREVKGRGKNTLPHENKNKLDKIIKNKNFSHRKMTKCQQQLEKIYSGITDASLLNNGDFIAFLKYAHFYPSLTYIVKTYHFTLQRAWA